MMFGLTCAHAAGAIAMVMVGMRLEVSPGVFLVNNEMLNGVVIMILITCIVSTMITQKAAQDIILSTQSRTISGTSADTLSPRTMLTRAQMAVLHLAMPYR
jgi:uncharacterized phage infection (PIP) family protein YhgE